LRGALEDGEERLGKNQEPHAWCAKDNALGTKGRNANEIKNNNIIIFSPCNI